MKISAATTVSTQLPTFSISVNGNKVKVYDNNKVYLKGGTQFELSFENLTPYNYKAEISFNDKKQGSGLVLSPGMRFKLDRFMDVDRKLLTDVYKVDDVPEVQEAISKNGWVSVSFFKEKVVAPITWTTNWNYSSTAGNGSYDVNNFSGNVRSRDFTKGITNTTNTSNTLCMNSFASLGDTIPQKETTRIEQGDKSNQEFRYINMDFEYNPDYTLTYQILPESFIPVNTVRPSDIRNYCQRCGRKIKKGWRGCPNCLIEA
jgi:hypothetical protein